MAYSFSILSSTGYPFYFKKIMEEPENVSLNMRFYTFVYEMSMVTERKEQAFELQAGLVSALYEFAKVLGYPIELLKYKSQSEVQEQNQLVKVDIPEDSDVLITARSESFLIPHHFEAKINLIYNQVIKNHLPIGPERRITDLDEYFILNLLNDAESRKQIEKKHTELDSLCESLLNEYKPYGLEALVITSFDGYPLKLYNIELQEACNHFRMLGIIPDAKEYQWVHRSSHQKGFFIINSGTGPKFHDLFMPYYYILITSEGAFLGDSPTTIYQRLNNVLIE